MKWFRKLFPYAPETDLERAIRKGEPISVPFTKADIKTVPPQCIKCTRRTWNLVHGWCMYCDGRID